MPLKTFTLIVIPGLVIAAGTSPARAADVPARAEAAGRQEAVVEIVDVAPVWAGHPVGFALLTHGEGQFVAFYDADRRLTLAQRRLDERRWQFSQLPVTTGWDSHNYLTMAVDDDGHLHLSGDMHGSPLNYWRTTQPADVATFEAAAMVGEAEERTTYPQFLRGPKGELLFTYRDGGSGRGDQIVNQYDHASRTWRRFLDAPLIDGEGQRNAYLDGPLLGSDGYYHLAWVWRDTPDAATNHHPSYARSKDLRHWETSSGRRLTLPIRWGDAEVIDPVPAGGGIINSNLKIGFDATGRVIVSYHKYDDEGHTQPFNARLEDGRWRPYQVADWPGRWEVGGRGSLGFPIRIGAVEVDGQRRLTQAFRHPKLGSGVWLLDADTLRAVGRVARPDELPAELGRPRGDFPGLAVRWSNDLGEGSLPRPRYLLRWETLGANHDQPRDGPLPPPAMLQVVAIERKAG